MAGLNPLKISTSLSFPGLVLALLLLLPWFDWTWNRVRKLEIFRSQELLLSPSL